MTIDEKGFFEGNQSYSGLSYPKTIGSSGYIFPAIVIVLESDHN